MPGSPHEIRKALLSDRACLLVGGERRAEFLQGLITNDVESLPEGEARFAALLTPQGKILFDFFVLNTGGAFIIDCAASLAAELQKRLTFYRLRAKVDIADITAQCRVAAVWGQNAEASVRECGAMAFKDPRLPDLGWRVLLRDPVAIAKVSGDDFLAYEGMRIGLAVPEGGKDYKLGDTFPHEACLDLLHGVDFKKGCYVGQEVVSRMQHRGTARTRVVSVLGDTPLEPGVSLTVDGFPIGRLGSASGTSGIALARLDRAAEAIETGQQILAGAVAVRLSVPKWASYSLSVAPEEAAH